MTPGTKLGPYEILEPIGAGGMGEVYKARDTRLDRTVAVKVLPSHIAAREDLRARFEREARAVSSLNHPHICTLHDVGKQDGVDFLVMEHLEGETLASRLERGPLPLAQVLRYAMQVADALDRAHRNGIVHRDLKPGNVMLTRNGAKVLDFGLARTGVHHHAASASAATVTQALTTEGTVLGTPQYMAPEQIEGGEADGRTDIFAFGCVVYEMVTGRRAFDGETRASIIGAILTAEPPALRSLQPVTPPALERVVARCLAKDAEDRYQSMRDVLLDVRMVESAPAAGTVERPSRAWLPWVVAALAVALCIAVVSLRKPATVSVPSFALTLPTAPGTQVGTQSPPVISPDGTAVVFPAVDKTMNRKLWVRFLNVLEARPLPGTEGATLPFWSPDSKYVAYTADGRLWRTDLTGGVPTEICSAPFLSGGAWGSSGVILFGAGAGLGLFHVSSNGGIAKPLTVLDAPRGEIAHRSPAFLSDGRTFVYTVFASNANTAGAFAASLDNPQQRVRLTSANGNTAFAPALGEHPAYLLWTRQQSLVAQKLDEANLRLEGEPITLLNNVQVSTAGIAAFTASTNGLLSVRQGDARELGVAWIHGDGKKDVVPIPPAPYGFLRLSPDGKKAAFRRGDLVQNWDVWTYEFERGVLTRLTFDGGSEGYPVWSPDGKQIAYVANRDGSSEIYTRSADGTGTAKQITQEPGLKATLDWSRDGRHLLYRSTGQASPELRAVDLQTGKSEGLSQNTSSGRISPNGRWLAYTSTESGRPEIFVQSFRGAGGKWQVSTKGGAYPTWSADGKKLFFTSDAAIEVALIEARDAGVEIGHVREAVSYSRPAGLLYPYDVAPDGKRFLVLDTAGQDTAGEMVVISDWQSRLNR